MATKPTVLPKWADGVAVDPISGQQNVTTPPTEKQNAGWDRLEFPPRNWFNWLGRYTYRWLNWLKQQEEQAIITNGAGEGLFPTDGALITLYAVDITIPTDYLVAVGFKESGVAPVLTVTHSNTLTKGASDVTGKQAIATGSGDANIIIWGQSKIIVP